MTARLFKLTQLHQRIDDALRREINRLAPDQLRVMLLKRQRHRVKHLLARLAPRVAFA